MGAKKNFVIDTNVILHDYNCLRNFQENDIYLPIVVLEELDKFKKGNEQINYNAREFVRQLDLITDDNLFTRGASLGEGMGRLFVVTGRVEAPHVYESFPESIPDHRILAVTDWLGHKHPDMKTILVTKDVNLRMKARSIGLLCEDYINDKVVNVDIFEKSNETFDGIDPALIDRIYSSHDGIDISELECREVIHPNECFILKSERNSVLARYNPFTHTVCRVTKTKNYGIEPRNAEQSFAFEILDDPNVKLVALTGKAGTGKTFLAVVLAVLALKKGEVQRIILTRPAVEAGESLGFLPGDLKEKVDPYLRPVYDALHQIFGIEHTTRLIERGVIEIAPLAYMRGRTLDDAFVILDEAQNTTISQMKMFLTRLGFHSKMIINGDTSQIDLPRGVTSGLLHAQKTLAEIEQIQFVYFDASDVVRHPIVTKIIKAYEQK